MYLLNHIHPITTYLRYKGTSFVSLFCLIWLSFPQLISASIRGTVTDAEGNTLPDIAVVALSLPDSIYVAGSVTDSLGSFDLSADIRGRLILRAEGAGFVPVTIPAISDKDNILRLDKLPVMLDEVTVTANLMQASPGKFSFIPGNLRDIAHNSFELLDMVPLLRITPGKDDIGILGMEGCTIFINGKEPVMPQSGVIEMLRASDAARVRRVEIWLTPGPAYQEYGRIVNVVLAPRTGMTGTADINLHLMNTMLSSRQQGWIGAEYDNWQFSANLAFIEDSKKLESTSLYTLNDESADNTWQTRHTRNRGREFASKIHGALGAGVNLGHNNSLGVKVDVIADYSLGKNSTWSTYSPANVTEPTYARIRRPFSRPHMIFTVNYDHELDSAGSRLWGRVAYDTDRETKHRNYTPTSSLQDYSTDIRSDSYQGSVTYSRVWNDRLITDFGLNLFADRIRRRQDFSGLVSDEIRQNQDNGDLFVSAEYTFSNTVGVSVGLRGRMYRRKISETGERSDHEFHDLYILPTASLSLNLSPAHIINLGYTMDVQQPYYTYTNPLRTWLTPTSYTAGNPQLKASVLHNLTLFYILRQKISLGLIGKISTNTPLMSQITDSDGITAYRYAEGGDDREVRIVAGYMDYLFDNRWIFRVTATGSHHAYDNAALSESLVAPHIKTWSGDITLDNNIYFTHDRSWDLSLTATYFTPVRLPLSHTDGYVRIDAGLGKEFTFGGRVDLFVYNAFNHRDNNRYACPLYSTSYRQLGNQTAFIVRFSMRFGKRLNLRDNATSNDFSSR